MTISTYRTNPDGMGGWSDVDLPAGGIIPCRCEAISGTERQIWLQEGVDISHRLYCDGAVGLTAMQTVRIDDTEYDVRFVRERGGRTKHLEADLTERRHDTN